MLRSKHIISQLVDDGRYDDGLMHYNYDQSARAGTVAIDGDTQRFNVHTSVVGSCDIKMNSLCRSRYAITPATTADMQLFCARFRRIISNYSCVLQLLLIAVRTSMQ
jgi:hypothetical protein